MTFGLPLPVLIGAAVLTVWALLLTSVMLRTQRHLRRANGWLVEDSEQIEKMQTELESTINTNRALVDAVRHLRSQLNGSPVIVPPPVPSTNPIRTVGKHTRL